MGAAKRTLKRKVGVLKWAILVEEFGGP